MSKNKKVVLGVATIWPIIYMVFFMLFVFSQLFVSFSGGPSEEPPIGSSLILIIFALHFLTMILTFVLLFIYIKNLFNNDRIAQDKKALWTVVLFLGNFIAMSIYWYLYIWKEQKKQQPLGPKT